MRVDRAAWAFVALDLIEKARGEVIDCEDAIPTLSAAIAVLKVEAGELEPDELVGTLDGLPVDAVCTCPHELVIRGGFRSSCLVHGGQR